MERSLLAVFSFYREDPDLLRRLDPLWACRVSRGWAALRIECRDLAHRGLVCGVIELLRPPLEALALVREIRERAALQRAADLRWFDRRLVHVSRRQRQPQGARAAR
jgi:hypothetical protein